ncbi:hypothetical protein IVW58_24320 [Salmonella enterica subsp. enterica serovar Worthington]|nr:hypothetical protein [Salmonella enterica subsp. enterica serovar Worthington]
MYRNAIRIVITTTDRRLRLRLVRPSGAVKEDLRRATLVSLPVPTQSAGEPIGILTRVDIPLSTGAQMLIAAIRKSMPL